MKIFIDFLIEKKLISLTQALEAMFEQIHTSHSLAEIIHENQLLSDEQIFEILKNQYSEGTDFRSSAKSLSMWSQEVEEKAFLKMKEKATSIGTILINKNYLNSEKLIHALDSYTGSYINEKEKKEEKNYKNSEKILDPLLFEEYERIFQNRIHPSILKCVESIREKKDFASFKNNLISEFVALKASATLLGSERMISFSSHIVEILKSFNNFENYENLLDWILKSQEVLKKALFLMSQNHEEDVLSKDPFFKEILQDFEDFEKKII